MKKKVQLCVEKNLVLAGVFLVASQSPCLEVHGFPLMQCGIDSGNADTAMLIHLCVITAGVNHGLCNVSMPALFIFISDADVCDTSIKGMKTGVFTQNGS